VEQACRLRRSGGDSGGDHGWCRSGGDDDARSGVEVADRRRRSDERGGAAAGRVTPSCRFEHPCGCRSRQMVVHEGAPSSPDRYGQSLYVLAEIFGHGAELVRDHAVGRRHGNVHGDERRGDPDVLDHAGQYHGGRTTLSSPRRLDNPVAEAGCRLRLRTRRSRKRVPPAPTA